MFAIAEEPEQNDIDCAFKSEQYRQYIVAILKHVGEFTILIHVWIIHSQQDCGYADQHKYSTVIVLRLYNSVANLAQAIVFRKEEA